MSNATIESFTSSPIVATTNGTSEEVLKEFRYIILPSIYTIVVFVGLIGNGIVIYMMHTKGKDKSITDIYVLNLAIADFIFVSMLPMWTVDHALGGWPFGGAMCQIASGCTYFDMYASVFFLTAMAVDRLIAVVLYSSMQRTRLRARVAVVSIWIFSGILGAVPTYFRGAVDISPDGLPMCSWTFDDEHESHQTWLIVFALTRSVVGFVIPFFIILICYSMIIYFLQSRKTAGKLTGKRQDRATKMVLVVIAVFLLCWLPNQISNLFYVAHSLQKATSDRSHYYIHMFTTTLAFTHSCINPILYAFMREDLRNKVTEMFHNFKMCCLCKKRDHQRVLVNTEATMTPKTDDRRKMRCDDQSYQLRLQGEVVAIVIIGTQIEVEVTSYISTQVQVEVAITNLMNLGTTPKTSLEDICDGDVRIDCLKTDEQDKLLVKTTGFFAEENDLNGNEGV